MATSSQPVPPKIKNIPAPVLPPIGGGPTAVSRNTYRPSVYRTSEGYLA